MPTSTDLVTDLPADFEVFGQAVDTSLADLKGGTTGQVLAKASGTDMDFTWSNVDPLTILDAKGDLITATAADTPARLASSGVNGEVLTVDTTTSTGLKWAAPAASGTTWTTRQAPGTTLQTLNQIEYNGSNLYVAVGNGGVLFTSPDAITWTSRTSGFGANDIYGVGFGNGLWVAVGQSGVLTTSSDGITWTARTANMASNQINKVVYRDSIWVAVGEGGGATNTGGLTYSTDGLTWTRKSQSVSVGTSYNCVEYNGTHWVIGANRVTSNNFIYATTPSGTWTEQDIGTQEIKQMELSGSTIYYSTTETSNQIKRLDDITAATATTLLRGYSQTTTSSAAKTWRIYNNRIYTFGSSFRTTYSTTLVNDHVDYSQTEIHGMAFSSNGSAISGSTIISYVNATGIVIGGSFGAIQTSF